MTLQRPNSPTAMSGFSLIELMISLVLGLIITGAVIQTLVGSKVTNSLNTAIAQVQESGRYIMLRLSRELIEAGRYDLVSAQIDNSVDKQVEAAFVENRPIALAGDFVSNGTLGAVQGASGANDELVINMLASQDCTGNRHGYAVGNEFHVVNHYFVSGGALKCTGYDGRTLRGLKVATSASVPAILMDNVESFQVQYGVTDVADTSKGQAVTYVTAGDLDALRTANQQVVAIRVALLIKSEQNQVVQSVAPTFAVLNESAVTLDKNHYYQVFTQTLGLRNMKNFVRSAQ